MTFATMKRNMIYAHFLQSLHHFTRQAGLNIATTKWTFQVNEMRWQREQRTMLPLYMPRRVRSPIFVTFAKSVSRYGLVERFF